MRRVDKWLGELTVKVSAGERAIANAPQGWRTLRGNVGLMGKVKRARGGGQNHPTHPFGRWLEVYNADEKAGLRREMALPARVGLAREITL